MAADGELSARRGAIVRQHLASCWSCRARMQEIETAITDFVRLRDHELSSELPPAAGPRALLRARLAALGGESDMERRVRSMVTAARLGARVLGLFAERSFPRRALALCGLASVLALALVVGFRSLLAPAESGLARLEPAAVPKHQLTPGATVPVTKQQVCSASSLPQGPGVPASLQQQVFEAYGIANPRPGAYEIDYLITPDLGGAANIRNLWPQPYSDTAWNARVKDQLEEHLHAMVCNGDIDVATAQHDLAADWISAYKKYFHTDRPRLDHSKASRETKQWDSPEDYAAGFPGMQKPDLTVDLTPKGLLAGLTRPAGYCTMILSV